MSEEIVYVKCANTICDKTIPFVKGAYALPEKTYCDYCCGGMTTPPNNESIDTRVLPKLRGRS